MNHQNAWFDELQKNVSDLLAKSPVADIERNMKAMLAHTFSRLDLITREEFDIQAQLLQRALERLRVLEETVQNLRAEQVVDPLGVEPSTNGL